MSRRDGVPMPGSRRSALVLAMCLACTAALGVPSLPPSAWKEDVSVPNVFNRLLVYRGDIVHAATSYFGSDHRSKRLTIVFFWRAS